MKTKLFISTLFLLSFLSCSKHSIFEEPERFGPFNKTILFYMVADNNLSSDGHSNVRKIYNGCNASNLKNNNILIYFDPRDHDPVVIQLILDNQNEVRMDTIHKFGDQNLASKEVLTSAIDLMKQYKSEKYDLVLWGHASNWLPADFKSKFTLIGNRNLQTYAFGDDQSRFLEIDEIAEVIPNNLFELILFDVCYMGSVEVAYELKNKAKNLIAASGEIIQYGFPYDNVMDYLLESSPDYRKICQEFYEYYENMSGRAQSATIGWTKLELMDELANVIKEMLPPNQEKAANIVLTSIQNFDRGLTGYRTMLDLDQYIESICTESEYTKFTTILKKAVPFERHTDWFYSEYAINRHCGLSIFPYYSFDKYTISLDYENLEWYKAVYE